MNFNIHYTTVCPAPEIYHYPNSRTYSVLYSSSTSLTSTIILYCYLRPGLSIGRLPYQNVSKFYYFFHTRHKLVKSMALRS